MMEKLFMLVALAVHALAAPSYVPTGNATEPQQAPYLPAGGVSYVPDYQVGSDFDYYSLQLALYQEYIELDLFRYGLELFSEQDFLDAGLTQEDRYLIQYMSDQEVGHAHLISNMLGPTAAKECSYDYPFSTVQGFIDFCQKLTKWGESGVYGFLAHLDSRDSATLLLQSITTEARQQLIFRQFEGLFSMPVWFEPGIPQSWAWTLLAPYIKSCPADGTRLAWQNFPALNISNNPDPTNPYVGPSVPGINHTNSSDSSALTFPGRRVELQWESAGKMVGPDNSYITSSRAGAPQFVAWVSQLNLTYTPLYTYNTTYPPSSGYTYQPGGYVYPPLNGTVNGTQIMNVSDPVVNGTMFIAVTDSDPFLTSFNLTMINEHVVAGPAIYQAG